MGVDSVLDVPVIFSVVGLWFVENEPHRDATQQIVGRERWERVSQLALWNYLFFRVQKLFMSVLVTFLAAVMDLVLLICLIRLDRVAAWALIPYLMYRLLEQEKLPQRKFF